MKASDESGSIGDIRLTPSEQRLVRGLSKYRRTLFFAFVLFVVICLVWLKHFQRFSSNPFFLAYNLVVYAALVWTAFSTARYQLRLHRLLERIRRHDNSESCSPAPHV
jgi:hypothetical protein